jgi:hypothetical protein
MRALLEVFSRVGFPCGSSRALSALHRGGWMLNHETKLLLKRNDAFDCPRNTRNTQKKGWKNMEVQI